MTLCLFQIWSTFESGTDILRVCFFVWSEWNHIFFSPEMKTWNIDLYWLLYETSLWRKNEHELNWDGNQCSYYSISIHQMTIWRTETIKNFENVPLILMFAPQITTLMWNSKWMVHKLKKYNEQMAWMAISNRSRTFQELPNQFAMWKQTV